MGLQASIVLEVNTKQSNGLDCYRKNQKYQLETAEHSVIGFQGNVLVGFLCKCA